MQGVIPLHNSSNVSSIDHRYRDPLIARLRIDLVVLYSLWVSERVRIEFDNAQLRMTMGSPRRPNSGLLPLHRMIVLVVVPGIGSTTIDWHSKKQYFSWVHLHPS